MSNESTNATHAPMDPFLSALSRRVNDLLQQRRRTQVELATAINRSQSFVSQFLSGKRGIDIKLLGPIATFFECDVADLFPAQRDTTFTPSDHEHDLVIFFREAHPHIRQAIASLLTLPYDHTASQVSPEAFRVASAYQQATAKDRRIVEAALGLQPQGADTTEGKDTPQEHAHPQPTTNSS